MSSPQRSRELLRFLTAGSVDDGKSTLIGRLLHDSGAIFEDEFASVLKRSPNGTEFDPSLLTDGLKAEREQGITIDVAYRYFSTPQRQFIIADTPGHEQYTRNMVTGASTAEAAVLLIDARKGILPQTRRHTYMARLLGIKNIVIAVNKMDLIDFDGGSFQRIKREYLEFAAQWDTQKLTFVPISALLGDNVISRSPKMPWYEGPSLLEILETLEVNQATTSAPFRFAVQTVIRARNEFRGYAGQIGSGTIRPGREVCVLPSGRHATVAKLLNFNQELQEAFAPMSIVLSLKEHTDLGRGDMLCDAQHPPAKTKRFRATLIWMSALPLRLSEPYLLKHTTQTACMSIVGLRHKLDIHSLNEVPADALQLNDIGEVEIETHKPLFCEPYAETKSTGSFIVIDPIHNTTLAAGIITKNCEESTTTPVSSLAASVAGASRGLTVWITGLSGSGKTTICEAVHTELLARGIPVEVLDGDVVRKHLSRELGFSQSERDENIRRIGFVAQLLTRNGIVALVSAISPYRATRDEIRQNVGKFIEVFANAPLEVCERRDPRGLYKKARAGMLRKFTGIDDPYEPPLSPEVECRTDLENIKESVDKVLAAILKAISVRKERV